MITGLDAYIREHGLAKRVDLPELTVGIDAGAIDDIEAASSVLASLKAKSAGAIFVFDGPGRVTGERRDGLATRRLQRWLLEMHVPFLVAPALAAAQLAYLARNRFISHVALGNDVWLFCDVPYLLDLQGEILSVTRSTVLNHLHIVESQLVELALAVGCAAMAEQMPLLDKNQNALTAAIQYATTNGQGSMLRAAAQYDPAYLSRYESALGVVAWQPVMGTNGEIELPQRTIPRDLHEILGRRLPDTIYWYINRGLLGVELPRAIQFGWFEDDGKLRPVASSLAAADYIEIERSLLEVRKQALALLVRPLHRYFQYKDVESRMEGFDKLERTVAVPVTWNKEAADAESVVMAATAHVNAIVGADDPISSLLGQHSKQLQPVVELALRELAEAAIYSLFESGHIPRTVDTAEIVKLLPYA